MIKLKSLQLDNFKGAKSKKYTFGNIVRLIGTNGTGKTTIQTAFYWLLADKDAELNSNPNVRPLNVSESIPTVTAVLDIDGKEITICKMQKCKTGKPDENGIAKVSLTNTYTINEVPKTERDFKLYLEELGLDFKNLLALSHPTVFMMQKEKDIRTILFDMAKSYSDLEIAQMQEETARLIPLLENYKAEEIEAMQKASKKKAVDEINSIPNQIIGMEKSKVDYDVAELELYKNQLLENIADIDKKLLVENPRKKEIETELFGLELDLNGIVTKVKDTLIAKKRLIEDKLEQLKIQNVSGGYAITISKAHECKREIENAKKKKDACMSEWKVEKAKEFVSRLTPFDESKWVFDDSSTVCSMCGQTLPQAEIDSLKEKFEKRKNLAKIEYGKRLKAEEKDFENSKKIELSEIERIGNKQKDIIAECEKEKEVLELKAKEILKNSKKLDKEIKELEKELKELPMEAKFDENEEYIQISVQICELKKELEKERINSNNDYFAKEELINSKENLKSELEFVKVKLAQFQRNAEIDEKIELLQQKQLQYEQVKADAESLLYQLSLVSKKKNNLLVDEINSHFETVKWKLFDYQKNGEYKEVCIPTVDGFTFGSSTNTGREIQAKLDICNSLQKFYGMNVPIFLDHASIIDEDLLPKLDCQLFLLVNDSDTKELKVEVV